MSVLALIPARSGSKGIPGKNFRILGDKPLWKIAADCAFDAGYDIGFWPPYTSLVVSSDAALTFQNRRFLSRKIGGTTWLHRPAELAQDDTPMIDVVKHALTAIPGPPDQIIVLLQPTQPFRTPDHVRQAITLLQETGADSVVSVVELPKTHSPRLLCRIERWDHGDVLAPGPFAEYATTTFIAGWEHVQQFYGYAWENRPKRRQDVTPLYKPDGTVYAFKRSTVTQHRTIYGQDVRPLIIDPTETCELDTESDWCEVERRWREHAPARS